MNDIIKHEWKNCKTVFSLLKKSHSTIMKKNILLFFAAFSLFLETNATTVRINGVEYEVTSLLFSLSFLSQPLSTLVNLCQPCPRDGKIKALKILRGRNALQR